MAERRKNRLGDWMDAGFLARLERLHLAAKSVSARPRPGARPSRRVGDGLEFADHRPYAPGDDVRFVDWRYYARMERLLVRQFHEHNEGVAAVLVDASASMAPGGRPAKFDQARRLAAALVYAALGSHERVELAAFAETLGPRLATGRRREGIFAVLEFLDGLVAEGRTSLASAVDGLLAGGAAVGSVLVLGDLLACRAELPRALDRLASAGCEVSLVHVYESSEAHPAWRGAMRLRDAESGQAAGVELTDELASAYERAWRDFVLGCQKACGARGVRYVPAPAEMALERVVLRSLRAAGVLAEA